MGFLPCPTTRLNYLTVRFQGRADCRQPPDPSEAQVGGRYRRPACRRARRRSWAGRRGWALRVGGKCGLVLQARWGGHGSLTLSPPGSSGPGHRILLVTETRCPPVPRLRTHGDGCALGMTGGEPRSLKGGGGGLAGTPLLPGSPYGPRRRRAESFEASIVLAPKAPKQNSGCQPQTLEGEEGGGPPSSCCVRPF